MYSRYGKGVKSISSLIRHVNVGKIQITLSSYQLSKPIVILEDNITNCPDLLSDINNESIRLEISNYGEKRIRLVDNNNKDIRLADIDQ